VGGLPEAVGPCGLLFPKGDAEALAAILKTLVADSCLREQLLAQRDNHLRRFHPEVVARNYLEFFATVVRDHSRSSILRRAKKD
jgi:glycosyltransferase involved in cell wall biosynthesis